VLVRLITQLAAGKGSRSRRQTTVPVPRGLDGLQDIADRLAQIHDYLHGTVESLDLGTVAELPPSLPQAESRPQAA
jgi:hypothetical protein